MKKTPLHAEHIGLGARMGEFGGWDMPIQYAGILAEHEHTRSKVSVFDICHMGEFELSGPTAKADVENLLTCYIESLKVEQVRYGFMLNDNGGTIDDLTCYRMAEDRFMLVVNAGTCEGDAEWIKAHISPETTFVDRSAELAKIDVQGPYSRPAMEEALGVKLPELGYFRLEEGFKVLDTECIISRTGYTGEWGYELYLPTADAKKVWDALLAHELIEPAGLGARDTLRLEMGYPLYGHELNAERTPAQTSRGMFISAKKDYIGKTNVDKDLDGQAEDYLVALRFESKRAARDHDKVFFDGQEIGEVTSGSLAPSLGVAVALAFVKAEFSDTGRSLQVEIRGKLFAAEIVDLPFYKDATARKAPEA